MSHFKTPPGPKGRWFTGCLREFRRDKLSFFTRCAREHGDLVHVRLGPHDVYLVNHPALIEEVLVSHGRSFTKHLALRVNPVVLGNGLLTNEGASWLRQRRLVQPAFDHQHLNNYAAVMVSYANRLAQQWKAGLHVDLHKEMMKLTLQIAAKTLFDADVDDEAREVGRALDAVLARFNQRFLSLVPLPRWLPTPGNLRLKRAVAQLDAIIYRFIGERRARGRDHEQRDLLSLLLHARDEDDGSRMSDRQLRDEAMTLFLAGHETTALALTWTWYLISQHPEIEAQLREEWNCVLGNRLPTIGDFRNLAFTERVVMEAMRLYPPAYAIGREATHEIELGGYPVPKGMTLIMSQWVVHRDPRFFPEPEAFQPQRWTTEAMNKLPRYAYFPFGGGPRVCIGNQFAMIESVLVLATLGQRFKVRLLPDQIIEPVAWFTLRPRSGIRVRLESWE